MSKRGKLIWPITPPPKPPARILPRQFYERDTITVSEDLLGKILVHESGDGTTAGKIVETEAYRGPEDKAAHSSGGRRTARNEIMFKHKGHAYVYFIYGLYHCFNVTAGNIPGKPEAVLIRALEPVAGEQVIAKRRGPRIRSHVSLTNGPSKLCMAMDITRSHNATDLTVPPLYIKDALPIPQRDIVENTRIGVDYADEWKHKPWRFYIKGNAFVSVK
jgi:DNA-3-methyladenine glycosylase